jgi:hypothetical protein
MPPAPASAEREEERRLNTRTLTIASIASATAAAVTSQLWIAGTWIAAALTPVLVSLISEAMHRPTERIARAWSSDPEARVSRAQTPTREEPAAVTGTPGPVRIYRQTGRGSTLSERRLQLSRRKIAIGGVALTAAIAFVIGILALTTVDLVSGGSVGKGSGRTTFFSGNKGQEAKDTQPDQTQQKQQQQQEPTDQQKTTPSEQPTTDEPEAETTPSDTAPVTPTTEAPAGEPAPDTAP